MGNIIETKQCVFCGQNFSITDNDAAFYERVKVPKPVECSVCRERRRLTFRNERNLYLRNCENCGKQMVSIYSPDKNYHVWCQPCFWSDKWDPVDVGRDFDFNRSFFEQFGELMHDSKLVALFGKNNQNAEFVNQETDDKNCFMNAGGHYNEDCYYNTYSIWGKNNVDCYWVIKSECLYECIRCENCFNSTYLQECENCSDCHYCRDLKGCTNCFGCFGLRHKKFHFFNQALSENDYRTKVDEYLSGLQGRNRACVQSLEHFQKYPHKAVQLINCEDCVGDDLLNCKDVIEGYLIENSRDVKYAYIGLDIKDAMDLSSFGWGEVLYNCASSGDLKFCIGCSSTWSLDFCQYCFVCMSSSHLFGCVGLHRKQYCILNKQYSKEEYEELLLRVIEHMEKSGEYGQFFPAEISPFGYHETVAMEYYPMKYEEDKKEYKAQTYFGLYDIKLVHDNIVSEILACRDCGKNYKIVIQELKFYRRMNLALPEKCPMCRHKRRLGLRNPRRLWDRKCDKCQKQIKTTYKPDSINGHSASLRVCCEKCYLEQVM